MNSRTGTAKRSRHIPLIALAAIAALAITPVTLMAQRGQGYGHGPHHGRGQMIERIFERLDLTDEQQEAVHDTMLQHREQMRPLHEQRMEKQRALGKAIHAEYFDENAVRQAAAGVAAVDADLAVMKAQMFQEINKILTPEQRERMNELIDDWHYMMDEFRGRGPGRGPGPRGSNE